MPGAIMVDILEENQGEMSKLFIIAGPCVVESREICFQVAEHAKKVCNELGVDYIFKASYKKANRSKLDSFTGIDKQEALNILKEVGEKLSVPVITDVHESHECAEIANYVDYLQIPAFLCRQTDLLIAAGNTGKGVNIKKGQFLAPEAMKFAADKVQSTGNNNIWLTERGTTFGYNNLVVDMCGIPTMKKIGWPVVIDATHAVQVPNQTSGVTGGNAEMIETIAVSAIAAGADGIFIEAHPEPAKALSDSGSQLKLENFKPLLEKALKVKNALD